MAEDLREKVEGYKLQLEQVEAMLTTDPENEELKKLKEDLTDVIQLSLQLLPESKQPSASASAKVSDPAAEASGSTSRLARAKPAGDNGTQLTSVSSLGQKRKNREEETKRREYKIAKKAKKVARQQELEQAHEADKQRWLDFNSRLMKHNKTHVTKTSIFATTDNLNGRVGVGTCGTSGKPITPASTFQPQRSATHPNWNAGGPKPFGLDRLGF